MSTGTFPVSNLFTAPSCHVWGGNPWNEGFLSIEAPERFNLTSRNKCGFVFTVLKVSFVKWVQTKVHIHAWACVARQHGSFQVRPNQILSQLTGGRTPHLRIYLGINARAELTGPIAVRGENTVAGARTGRNQSQKFGKCRDSLAWAINYLFKHVASIRNGTAAQVVC